MFLGMIERLVGFVVVNRPVLLMMVVDALVMLKLVDQRRRAGCERQAALHGEAIHGQAQQQEDVENPAQKSHQVNLAKL